jgi:hypothetical protein
MQEPPENLAHFSLIRNDLLFRMQRRIGLIPQRGLGIVRRAVFWSLLAWLPIAIWAAATGHWIATPGSESLPQHFGVNVRCLVAIPLFIIAEGSSHRLTISLLPYFETSGLVRPADVPRFHGIIGETARLRDRISPWIVILALIIAKETLPISSGDAHELVWSSSGGPDASLGFGGWWYFHVARAIYLALQLAWLWRVILLTTLFARLSRLPLQLVPTHPDGAGGLGFIERFLKVFAPVGLATSAVASARWAHDVLYHGVAIESIRTGMIALAILLLLIFLAPGLVWIGKLAQTRQQALLDYGALVATHGRLVRRRWIDRNRVDDDAILSAPELGPVADTAALYEAVTRMRIVPLGKSALLSLAIPIAIPMLAVIAIQIPIKQILLTLLKTVA